MDDKEKMYVKIIILLCLVMTISNFVWCYNTLHEYNANVELTELTNGCIDLTNHCLDVFEGVSDGNSVSDTNFTRVSKLYAYEKKVCVLGWCP